MPKNPNNTVQFQLETTKAWLANFKGIILAIMAGLFYTSASTLIKLMENKNPSDIAFYNTASMLLFALPNYILHCPKPKMDRFTFILAAISGVLGGLSLQGRVHSIKLLPLGDAVAIMFNTPVFVAVFARIFLKEKVSRVSIVAIIISIVGLLLIAKLPETIREVIEEPTSRLGTTQHLIGCAIAFGTVACSSVQSVLLRKLKANSPIVVTMILTLFLFLVTVLMNPMFSTKPFTTLQGLCTYKDWQMVGCGLCAVFYINFNVAAIKFEQVALVTIIITSVDTSLGFLAQVVFFNEPISKYSCAGSVLVFIAGLLIFVSKWIITKPENSKLRQWFKCIEN